MSLIGTEREEIYEKSSASIIIEILWSTLRKVLSSENKEVISIQTKRKHDC